MTLIFYYFNNTYFYFFILETKLYLLLYQKLSILLFLSNLHLLQLSINYLHITKYLSIIQVNLNTSKMSKLKRSPFGHHLLLTDNIINDKLLISMFFCYLFKPIFGCRGHHTIHKKSLYLKAFLLV